MGAIRGLLLRSERDRDLSPQAMAPQCVSAIIVYCEPTDSSVVSTPQGGGRRPQLLVRLGGIEYARCVVATQPRVQGGTITGSAQGRERRWCPVRS